MGTATVKQKLKPIRSWTDPTDSRTLELVPEKIGNLIIEAHCYRCSDIEYACTIGAKVLQW